MSPYALVGIVVFFVLLFLSMIYVNKKEREAADHIRKGGTPRTFTERKAKFEQALVKDIIEMKEAPHLLTCPHGIVRYRLKIPPTLQLLSAFSGHDESEDYKKLDDTILKLLETDPNLDLTTYAAGLGIELIDFHRKGPLPSLPTSPRIFALKNIVLSYDVKDPAKSPEEIDQQLRLILDAHPSADLNALASDLGITIRNIQRRSDDEGFPPYDAPIGTKSP